MLLTKVCGVLTIVTAMLFSFTSTEAVAVELHLWDGTTVVGSVSTLSTGTTMEGLGNGKALLHQPSDLNVYEWNGASLVWSSGNFSAGTVLEGLGNGTALLHQSSDLNVYTWDGASYGSAGGFSAGTVLEGLGNGTALLHQSSDSGVYVWDGASVSPTGSGFSAGTVLEGLGNGTALLHQSSDSGVYVWDGASVGWSGGNFSTGTVLEGLGDGTALLWQPSDLNLYVWNGTSVVWSNSALSDATMEGLGNGTGLAWQSIDERLYEWNGSSLVFTGSILSSGFVMESLGNGKALVWDFDDTQIYEWDGTSLSATGTYVASGLEMEGLGDGTGLIFGDLTAPPATEIEWSTAGSGDWNTATNWSPNISPGTRIHTAIFANAIALPGPETVTTNLDVAVKGITFGDTNSGTLQASYVIAGTGSVSLDSKTNLSEISVLEGSHEFQTVVNLVNATGVNVAAGSSLTFGNTVNLNGNMLTKTGTGTIDINSTVNTGVGGLVVVTGGVLEGTGTINGDLINGGGTVVPGNGPGTLTVTGDYLQSNGSLLIEINGLLAHDVLNVTGDLTISGASLDVVLGGFAPSQNDSFDILDFGSINLLGATLNLESPGGGLSWDTSQLSSMGILSVILLGDFDGDGFIDIDDYGIMKTNFFSTGIALNALGEVTGDGVVNVDDFRLFKETLFPNGPMAFAAALEASMVPEPNTVLLLLAATPAGLLLRFRRRTVGRAKQFAGWCLGAICALALSSGVSEAQLLSGDPGFGRQWVQSNPFLINGLIQDLPGQDQASIDEYWATNFSYFNAHPNFSLTKTQQFTEPLGKPWIWNSPNHNFNDENGETLAALAVPGLKGIMLRDEPPISLLPDLRTMAVGIRAITREHPVWLNLPGGPTSAAYFDELAATVNPDILQYDYYPYEVTGTLLNGPTEYFAHMTNIRNRALTENKPYSAFIQSFNGSGRRTSSESEMRMNVYSHLTAGFTGISYFLYNEFDTIGTGLLDTNDNPTGMYFTAQAVNAEVQNLGRAMRLLTSTDFRFIPGITSSVTNPTPSGLTNWSLDAGGDTLIDNVTTTGSDLTQNGLIGNFTGDDGQRYFMLTNMDQGQNQSAASQSLSFSIQFDPSVSELLRLNRLTGEQEVVPLVGNVLNTTLLGGTGDLYKYNTGNFKIALEQPASLELRVNRFTGETRIVATGHSTDPAGVLVPSAEIPADLDSYTISSPVSALNPGQWDTLVAQEGGGWEVVSATDQALIELNFSGTKSVLGGSEISLGRLYDVTDTLEDISFTYGLAGDGSSIVGSVAFEGVAGDFDSDLDVDGIDLAQWEGDFGVNGFSDADRDGDSDGADFLIWQRQFGTGVSALSSVTTQVPEPASVVLLIALTVISGMFTRIGYGRETVRVQKRTICDGRANR